MKSPKALQKTGKYLLKLGKKRIASPTTKMPVFTKTHTTLKMKKKVAHLKMSMKQTSLMTAKQRKRLPNKRLLPKKANSVVRMKKKSKQLIRLSSIRPPLMKKRILMKICRSVTKRVDLGLTKKRMNTI
jgi:hypothetical protein